MLYWIQGMEWAWSGADFSEARIVDVGTSAAMDLCLVRGDGSCSVVRVQS